MGTWTSSGSDVYLSGGKVGVNDTTPDSSLDVIDDSQTAGIRVRHSNLTQGVSIGYNTIQANGSNTNQDLNIAAKGAGLIGMTAKRVDVTGSSAFNGTYPDTGSLVVHDAANTGRLLSLGYDPTLEAGFIQAAKYGVAYEPLLLNPNGGGVDVGKAGVAGGSIGFAGATSGRVVVQGAAAAGTWIMTLPTGAGSNGQFLQTDGSGVTSWSALPNIPTSQVTGLDTALYGRIEKTPSGPQTINGELSVVAYATFDGTFRVSSPSGSKDAKVLINADSSQEWMIRANRSLGTLEIGVSEFGEVDSLGNPNLIQMKASDSSVSFPGVVSIPVPKFGAGGAVGKVLTSDALGQGLWKVFGEDESVSPGWFYAGHRFGSGTTPQWREITTDDLPMSDIVSAVAISDGFYTRTEVDANDPGVCYDKAYIDSTFMSSGDTASYIAALNYVDYSAMDGAIAAAVSGAGFVDASTVSTMIASSGFVDSSTVASMIAAALASYYDASTSDSRFVHI
jgi:hypothetical protein